MGSGFVCVCGGGGGDVLELILWGYWGITVYFIFYVFTFLFSVLNLNLSIPTSTIVPDASLSESPLESVQLRVGRTLSRAEGQQEMWQCAMMRTAGTISRGWKGTTPWPGIWILALQFPAGHWGTRRSFEHCCPPTCLWQPSTIISFCWGDVRAKTISG